MTRVRERSRAKKSIVSPEVQEVLEQTAKKPSKDMRRYIELSYRLIECKICYYYPELIKEGYRAQLEVHDDIYDQMEREYIDLCIKLGKENTVSHSGYRSEEVKGEGMFEVDFKRPAVHLVMRKWGVKNWQEKRL